MSNSVILKSYEFRREREATWRELEVLVARVEKRGVSALSADELERLPQLYRATLSSLSVARSISFDRNVVEYLEGLTQRAYFCVYSTKTRFRDAIVNFFRVFYPAMVWHYRYEVLVALLLLIGGTLIGFQIVSEDESRFYEFVDHELAGERGPQSSREELEAVLFPDESSSGEELSAFSAFLFRHNTGVGILAFSLGFLAGIPTAILLFQTGLMLGAFWAIHANRGLSYELFGWLLIHGVTELLAIVLCGAAGFVIARALVFPGRVARLDRLASEGKRAGAIMLGTVLLFCVAGVLEGVFRQTIVSTEIRYSVAGTTGAIWVWYFIWHGRKVSS